MKFSVVYPVSTYFSYSFLSDYPQL